MSVKMDQKVDSQLVDSVLDFLKVQAEGRATGERSLKEPSPIVLDAFRRSFLAAGLDGVDDLIDAINAAIKSAGGTEGFGDGAAIQHASGDQPAFLHIFYVEFESGKVLAREAISLPVSSAPAPN